MKNCLILLFVNLTYFGKLMTQNSFSVNRDTVWTIVKNEEYDTKASIIVYNKTDSAQSIQWIRTEIELTDSCQTQVSDPNSIYIPIVSTRSFDISANDSGIISLHLLNPKMVPDAKALVFFKLFNINNPSDSVVVVYLFTPETSGIKDHARTTAVKLFPNPASNYFVLENTGAIQNIRLFSLDGREAAKFKVVQNQIYSLNGLLSGSYILILEDKNGKLHQPLPVIIR